MGKVVLFPFFFSPQNNLQSKATRSRSRPGRSSLVVFVLAYSNHQR